MIIPIRCFTCGKIIANKYEKYCSMVKERNKKEKIVSNQDERIDNRDIFEKLSLHRYCCRRMVLSHIDLIEILK
jgi:DNA-directed RNA polymerase subunit N